MVLSSCRGFGRVVAVFALEGDVLGAEVDHEAGGGVGGLEVVHELDFVGFGDSLDGFKLEDHAAFDDDVGEEGADDGSVVEDVDGRLDDEGQGGFVQFHGHGLLVDGFQEAGAEGVVHLERAANDFFSERIVDHACIPRGDGVLASIGQDDRNGTGFTGKSFGLRERAALLPTFLIFSFFSSLS